MGAITTDAKTPILGDGKRDPTKTYMEFTRGIWIRKNLATDTLELWYNGNFHCAWDEANVIEPRLDAILSQAVSIGEQEAKRQIRATLGSKNDRYYTASIDISSRTDQRAQPCSWYHDLE